MGKKKYFIAVLAIVILLILRAIVLRKPDTALTYVVKKENLVDTVAVSGTYKTALQKEVLSPATGIIQELYVVNNQMVAKGDKLFYIESTATYEEKAATYVNYASALSDLKTAKQNKEVLDATMWTKQKALLDAQNNVDYKNNNTTNPSTKKDYTDLEKVSLEAALTQARKDFTSAEQKYKETDVAITAAQAKVNSTWRLYEATQNIIVNAPANGKIVNLSKKIFDQITAAQTVLIILDQGNPYITASVGEDYAVRINNGQKVQIVFDSLKDKTFLGQIEHIDEVGTINQGITTYDIRVTVNQIPKSIKPNMTALLTVETLRKNNVLDIPNSAIITKNNQNYVEVKKRPKNILAKVTLGIKGIAKTEIKSGLIEGQVVIINPGE